MIEQLFHYRIKCDFGGPSNIVISTGSRVPDYESYGFFKMFKELKQENWYSTSRKYAFCHQTRLEEAERQGFKKWT